ncbi:Mannan endo-1,4-beta-mannosidase [Phytophthora palmivora]|uniref:mannan endo-1,4-beta-mannosidase n=1 Tax=Phytophthora palmivora TaxID=4796 RepID=A0A2P4YP58_9STRA|nr:Mannan endo-1,4-beta-mannosidase [Phytophthora palmivora]
MAESVNVYVKQLAGTYHDDFYTDETIQTVNKRSETLVERYADGETIMAWELCNECRCAGSGDGLKKSGNCTTTALTKWMTEMSSYIKTLYSNDLVASKSEGFTDKSVYLYSGLRASTLTPISPLTASTTVFTMRTRIYGVSSGLATTWPRTRRLTNPLTLY